jgi:phage gpG-like protein
MTIECGLLDFARILERAAKSMQDGPTVEGEFRWAMVRACVLVQSDAMMRIGEYQAAVGPFPRWQQLAASTQAERARLGFTPNDPLERTGKLARSIEITIQGHTGYVGTNDPVAEYQEYGTARIPPRPFLGPAAFVNEARIQKLFARAVARSFGIADTFRSMNAEYMLGDRDKVTVLYR